MFDTGSTVQESTSTLLYQQQLLIAGRRAVQMFPTGTRSLKLPPGMRDIVNHRGTFHYNPAMITAAQVLKYSNQGRENEILQLGPYSKADVKLRMHNGETFTVISEYTPSGVEVRTAAGTDCTLPEQMKYFERTKQIGNFIFCGALPQRIQEKLKENIHGSH